MISSASTSTSSTSTMPAEWWNANNTLEYSLYYGTIQGAAPTHNTSDIGTSKTGTLTSTNFYASYNQPITFESFGILIPHSVKINYSYTNYVSSSNGAITSNSERTLRIPANGQPVNFSIAANNNSYAASSSNNYCILNLSVTFTSTITNGIFSININTPDVYYRDYGNTGVRIPGVYASISDISITFS